MQARGWFISIEGIDGAGKTTLKDGLLAYLQDKYDVVSIREPGGTVVSEKIRDMLLDVRNDGILARTEALLYAAARSQVVEEIISPALDSGKIVIADRYMDSTIAYQGYGRGLDVVFLHSLNELCTRGIKPDLTLLLDIDPAEALSRRIRNKPDRLEKEGIEFQSRVREGYLRLQQENPARIKLLPGSLPISDLYQAAIQYVDSLDR